jgi:hypothetical protein
MSDPPEPSDDREARPASDDGEDAAVRALLKRSLATDAIAKDAPDLLGGVQRRIRKRSRGKFFGDGWSTTQTRASYVLVALVTLLLVALAYYALGPMDVR